MKKYIDDYSHTATTGVIMLIAIPFDLALAASFFFTGLWLGREGAQASQRYLDMYLDNQRANGSVWLPIKIFFIKLAWNDKSFYLDMMIPIAAAHFISGAVLLLGF